MTPNPQPSWLGELKICLEEHYQASPEAMGSVLLIVKNGDLNWCIRIDLGESLKFLSVESQDEYADSKLVIQFAALDRILKNPEHFEPRSDFFAKNIHVSGDAYLSNHLMQFFKRPGEYALQILSHVRAYSMIPSVVLESNSFDFAILLECAAKNQPIVFRSIFAWPICSWDLDEFDAKVGGLAFRFNPELGRMETFADFSENLRQEELARVYTSGAALPESMAHYFPFPSEFDRITTPYHMMWFGRSRPGTPLSKLHCDIFTSLLAQVWGKKKAKLYPPQHFRYVYPVEAFSGHQPCMADPLNPDLMRHPEFSKAQCFEVEINPGDLLIIPSGWFHCLEADGLTFSVSKGLPLEVAYDLLGLPHD